MQTHLYSLYKLKNILVAQKLSDMNESKRSEEIINLKTIIRNASEDLPTGEMLALINLSAKADLNLKNNNNENKIAAGNIEIEMESMIKKYGQFLK